MQMRWRLGDDDDALSLFFPSSPTSSPSSVSHVCEHPPGILLQRLLNALVDSGDCEHVLSFFRYYETAGLVPNLQTYNVLIKFYCKRGDFSGALMVLQGLFDLGIEPSVYSYGTVMSGLDKSGNVDGAYQLFDEMYDRGVRPDVACYNVLTDGFFKNEDYAKAQEIWDRLVEIKGLCNYCRVSNALRFLDDALARGVTPTAITWTILVKAVANRAACNINWMKGLVD